MRKAFFLVFIYFLVVNFHLFGSDDIFLSSNYSMPDTLKKPAYIIGGGILMMPILVTAQKRQINYTAPLLITTTGVLLISSSIKRAQTDWYNSKINGRIGPFSVDDYLIFGPNALVFGLNFAGVKAKHSFKERLLVTTMANAISVGIVNGLKYTTRIIRPDKSTRNSFPSGHTAFAFTGAQLMHEEYGQNSIAYSIAGYGIGASVGGFRMINNRHWLSDVVAGAGIGMLSTKLAYRLLPWANKKIFKKNNLAIMPIYLPKGAGFSMALGLK
jgi:membrane-associated phospholipid phosphatase